MSGRRLLSSLAAAKRPFVATSSNIRAIHIFPTIDARPWNFDDESKVDRHRRLLVTDFSSLSLTLKRYKSSKKKPQQAKDEESDEEDDDDVGEDDKSNKVLHSVANSMRIDLIVKICVGIPRAKAEEALYDSKIRINGEKVMKKSTQARIGDVIDVVRGPSPKNPDFIVVSRVTILSAVNEQNGFKIKYTRDKSLVIENYEDGWTPIDS